MMRRWIIWGSALLLVIGACIAFFSVLNWHKRNEPKKSTVLQDRITLTKPVDISWNVTIQPEKVREINNIFNQHFHFIGYGKQCTAYASHDGQYVVKFLLQRPLKIKPRFEQLPDYFPFTVLKSQKVAMHDDRKNDLYNALMISYHIAPEQTGVLYVHLNPTNDIFKKPLIIDEKFNPVYIDTDCTQFIIQKRAKLVKPTIIDLMREGRVVQAKDRIDQILTLLFEAAKKGVVDADPSLIRNNNIGFLENRAIYIDTGKLRLVKAGQTRKDFEDDLYRLKPFYKWLQAYYPELAEHFDTKQQQLINSY